MAGGSGGVGSGRAGGRHGEVERSRKTTRSGFFGLRLLLLFLASRSGGVREHPPQAWPGVGGQTQAHTGHRETTPKATVDRHPLAPSPWPLGRPTGKSKPPKAQAGAPPGCVPGQNSTGSGRLSPPWLACHPPWSHPRWSLPVPPRGVQAPDSEPTNATQPWVILGESPRGGNPAEVSSGRHPGPPPASPLFS